MTTPEGTITTRPESGDSRAPLSRHRIVAAAIDLADRDGVAAVSMRKLAAALGYEAMSLYNHIANKSDLIEAMVDGIYGDLRPPVPTDDWKLAIRRRAIEVHRMLLRHPWAPPLLPFQFPCTNRWDESEYLLKRLAEAGFDDHTGDLGYHAITLHIAGFTQQQVSYSTLGDDAARLLGRMRRDAPVDVYPLMNAHVDYHVERDTGEHPDEFEFVLDLILDGLDRLRTR